MQNKSIAYAGNDNVLAPRLRASITFSMALCVCPQLYIADISIYHTHLYTYLLLYSERLKRSTATEGEHLMQMSFVANDAFNFCKFVPEQENNSVNIKHGKLVLRSSRTVDTLARQYLN